MNSLNQSKNFISMGLQRQSLSSINEDSPGNR